MSRKPFEPTDQERANVRAMAGYGISQTQMCLVIERPVGKAQTLKPISEPTLRKYFRRELDLGEPVIISKAADALSKIMLDEKHPKQFEALRFFLKCRAQWRETDRLDVTGGLEINFEGATDEELAVLERFYKRKVSDAAPAAANDRAA